MAQNDHGVDALIRFMPDDWLDVVMRPLDMVSPEANVYVEIAAPDMRLAVAILLAATVLLLLWGRRASAAHPVLSLFALLLVSMGVWLATTGNGRYFIAWLLLLGPLCMGLIRMLPTTAPRKIVLGGALIIAQLFLLTQNSPWGNWTWAQWTDPPYFQLDVPPADSATYVTVSTISYSLVASQFPAQSRWVGLGGGIAERDVPAVSKLLAASQRLTLMVPAIPPETLPDGQPSAAVTQALGKLLQPHGLFLQSAAQCRYLASGGMWRIAHRQGVTRPSDAAIGYGFWLCALQYRPGLAPVPSHEDQAVKSVFEAVERLCPRFFPAGGAPTKINGGWLKNYDSDTKIYMLDDGIVYYKFWRSLNFVEIGSVEQVRASRVSLDCSKIRAPNWRRGGP
jgi:hypothetical protein